jgi:hypothetical protein
MNAYGVDFDNEFDDLLSAQLSFAKIKMQKSEQSIPNLQKQQQNKSRVLMDDTGI